MWMSYDLQCLLLCQTACIYSALCGQLPVASAIYYIAVTE